MILFMPDKCTKLRKTYHMYYKSAVHIFHQNKSKQIKNFRLRIKQKYFLSSFEKRDKNKVPMESIKFILQRNQIGGIIDVMHDLIYACL